LVIGNKNAITYKEVFKLIKENRLWLGHTSPETFKQPDGAEVKQMTGLCKWFTNLETDKRTEDIILYRNYNEKDYPKYDNYDAIEVSRIANIPTDYGGVMGVPITFLESYNPEKFEIVKFRKGDDDKDLTINGKSPYFRILIKRRQQS
jgi:hypothetical protein